VQLLLKLLLSGKVYGPVMAVTSSYEFQKRGLPHIHIVVWLHPNNKVRRPAIVDTFVRATIPDAVREPDLHRLVTRHMLHNLCGAQYHGAQCMRNGKCSKDFPKSFREETIMKDDKNRIGYRRPNDGSVYIDSRGRHFTNRNVVSYTPLLLKVFESHVNVDVCRTYASLRYIFKYIFKGEL
jgi:hypothetical protein